ISPNSPIAVLDGSACRYSRRSTSLQQASTECHHLRAVELSLFKQSCAGFQLGGNMQEFNSCPWLTQDSVTRNCLAYCDISQTTCKLAIPIEWVCWRFSL